MFQVYRDVARAAGLGGQTTSDQTLNTANSLKLKNRLSSLFILFLEIGNQFVNKILYDGLDQDSNMFFG